MQNEAYVLKSGKQRRRGGVFLEVRDTSLPYDLVYETGLAPKEVLEPSQCLNHRAIVEKPGPVMPRVFWEARF